MFNAAEEVHSFVAILSESHDASKRCGEMVNVSLRSVSGHSAPGGRVYCFLLIVGDPLGHPFTGPEPWQCILCPCKWQENPVSCLLSSCPHLKSLISLWRNMSVLAKKGCGWMWKGPSYGEGKYNHKHGTGDFSFYLLSCEDEQALDTFRH